MASSIDARKLITKFAQDNSDTEALQFISVDPEGIDIKELVGDGAVNYIYRVSSKDKTHSVIIKYGEEHMRFFPTEKVSLDRQVLEYDCLQLLHSTHPGSVPEPYCFDRNHNALAMQDMKGWELLDSQLARQEVDLRAATYLGHQLARIHKATTQEAVGDQQWHEMQAKFSQDEAKNFIIEMMFIRPLDEKDDVNKIPAANLEKYRTYGGELKQFGLDQKMSTLFKVNRCFIHGDCHTKAIFVKDGCTALFDFEYAFLGHPASNLAFPVAGYIFRHKLQKAKPTSLSVDMDEQRNSFEQGARYLVEGYLKVIDDMSEHNKAIFLSELALFIGGTLFMISVSAFLVIFSEVAPEESEAMMETGYKLLMTHDKIRTVDQLINAMFSD